MTHFRQGTGNRQKAILQEARVNGEWARVFLVASFLLNSPDTQLPTP
ncbi:hypothetical protein M595_5278 [Lyngbya aestuarii BL J]|uniref:Uncharacterized protein n=1 Tax=Lyngbya aestuarii BL J TaxID=1348334 RepID=U7QDH1_9CYAN|nr:hypothetical protein M595_5278 [Lyngbya aestuarii BL J]